jgi:hypothetical protein
MRFFEEIRSNPKFHDKSVEQVANLTRVRLMTNRTIDGSAGGSVVYFLAMDDRNRESYGNAVLIWGSADKIYEDPIEINNRGFKYWSKGPFPRLSDLINWWKQGGYRDRQYLIEDWKSSHAKQIA